MKGDADLSRWAEARGDAANEVFKAESELIALLDHASPIVREGAVYGLAKILRLGWVSTFHALERAADHDASPGVREAAREALET